MDSTDSGTEKKSPTVHTPVVAVHGGAWDIPQDLWEESLLGVKKAALLAYQTLLCGRSAVDAVEDAVVSLEDNPVYDAGRGSVLTSEGGVEVAALIMRGDDLNAGAVAAAKNLLRPIQVARKVMEETQHVLVAGQGANRFAQSVGIEQHPVEDLLTEEGKRQLEKYRQYKTAVSTLFNEPQGHDTVGCVAMDSTGLMSCGTSTGGITGQMPGRVGDSPLIGSGGFADNGYGAVSTTGHGESIAKVNLASRVINEIEKGHDATTSGEKCLHYMLNRVGGRGGCVVISRDGSIGVPFTTARMPWASAKDGVLKWGMNVGQVFTEDIDSLTK